LEFLCPTDAWLLNYLKKVIQFTLKVDGSFTGKTCWRLVVMVFAENPVE
jgi:hypothetical protein